MKTIRFFLPVMALMVLSCAACGGDEDVIPGVDAGSGTVSAQIDGQNFQSKSSDDGATFVESLGNNTMQAYAEDDAFISLTIAGTLVAGSTYSSSNGIVTAQYKPDFMGTETYTASGGIGSASVTITTANNNKVVGTFQFTGVKFDQMANQETIEVTNGSFEFNL